MTQSKHTPGPWIITGDNNGTDEIVVRGREVLHVAHVCNDSTLINDIDPIGRDEQEANARLIAAAPDLLAALELLIEADEQQDPFNDRGMQDKGEQLRNIALAQARAAIAKTRGEA